MVNRIIDVDIEAIVLPHILTDTDLQTIYGTDPMRVAGELEPADATLPAARLQRITTGRPAARHLSNPVLEADVYADNKPDAYDAAAALESVMLDQALVATHADLGVVTGIDTAQGIRELEDTEVPHLRRYIFSIRYYCHPLPQ